MKNIRSIVIAGITAVMAFSVCSCDSYLDVDRYIYDMTSLDSIFKRKSLLEQYINGASMYLPREEILWWKGEDPFALTTDEAFCSFKMTPVDYAQGKIDRFSSSYDYYNRFYKGIRRANQVIQRIHECEDISEVDRRDFTGRAHFLRAYLYYSLLRQYGPVPILPDDPLPTNGSTESLSFPRGTYDECVDYICENLESAAAMLLDERPDVSTYRVPTKGAALSIISRIRLEAASPWFNGNPYYYDFIRHIDGVPYISQTKDLQKWGIAAAAAKRVINLDKYALFTVPKDADTPELPKNVPNGNFPNGAGDIDPFRSYNDMFTGEELALNVSEYIWTAGFNNDVLYVAFPAVMGGGNGLNVSQQLVDAYKMVDGYDINESSQEYPYPVEAEAWKPIGNNGKSFSGYQMPAQVAKMYDNREMRFYATIAFNHRYWEASSYAGTEPNKKNLEVTYYIDGTGAAWGDHPDDKSFSGYNCCKYVHTSDSPKGGYRSKYFPLIRYAEILLNYVEAMNEMEEGVVYTDEDNNITVKRDKDEMRKYFNMIRFRAGLPGVTDAELNDPAKMREIIKRERQVEFALEGRRFFDLRRWGDLTKNVGTFYGMNVNAKSSNREAYHKRTAMTWQYSIYTISNKLMFYPIIQTVMNKNVKLDQNPGW